MNSGFVEISTQFMRLFRALRNSLFMMCEGCDAEIDPGLTRHEWFDEDEPDEDDSPTSYYHVDCCPRNHVSDGDCGDEDD